MEQKEKIDIQLEWNKEIRIPKKKMRRGLGTPGASLNVPISKSLGCQNEKRKSKKLNTYLKT